MDGPPGASGGGKDWLSSITPTSEQMPGLMGLAGLALALSSRGGSPASQIGSNLVNQFGQYTAQNPFHQAELGLRKRALDIEQERYKQEFGDVDVTPSINALRRMNGQPEVDTPVILPRRWAAEVMSHVATAPKPEETYSPADILQSVGAKLPQTTEQVPSPENMSMASVPNPEAAAQLAALQKRYPVSIAGNFAKLYLDAEAQNRAQQGLAALARFNSRISRGEPANQAFSAEGLAGYGYKPGEVYQPTIADQIRDAQAAGVNVGVPTAQGVTSPTAPVLPPGAGPVGPPAPTPPAPTPQPSAPAGGPAPRVQTQWGITPHGLQLSGTTTPPSGQEVQQYQAQQAVIAQAKSVASHPGYQKVLSEMEAKNPAAAASLQGMVDLAQRTGDAATLASVYDAMNKWSTSGAKTVAELEALFYQANPAAFAEHMQGRVTPKDIQSAIMSKERLIEADPTLRHKVDANGQTVLNPKLAQIEAELGTLYRQQASSYHDLAKTDPSNKFYVEQALKNEAFYRRVPVAQVVQEFQQMHGLSSKQAPPQAAQAGPTPPPARIATPGPAAPGGSVRELKEGIQTKPLSKEYIAKRNKIVQARYPGAKYESLTKMQQNLVDTLVETE